MSKNPRSHAVSFIGLQFEEPHLRYHQTDTININYPEVYAMIKSLYERGYTTFYTGMTEKFDLLAAEIVLDLKKLHSEIKIVAVIPFIGQDSTYSLKNLARYRALYYCVDEVIVTSEKNHKTAFTLRNNYLLASCSLAVCFYFDTPELGAKFSYLPITL